MWLFQERCGTSWLAVSFAARLGMACKVVCCGLFLDEALQYGSASAAVGVMCLGYSMSGCRSSGAMHGKYGWE